MSDEQRKNNIQNAREDKDLPEEKKQVDNNLDYIAYLLYQLDAKESGYHAWRWLCLNEDVKEKFRSKARQKVDDWIYEEDFMKEKRKQY